MKTHRCQKLILLSVRQAAEESGVSYKLLLAAVDTGRIKTVTLSRRRLIPDEALRAFVEEANRPCQIQGAA